VIGVFLAYAGILAGNHDNMADSPLSVILGVSMGNFGGAKVQTMDKLHNMILLDLASVVHEINVSHQFSLFVVFSTYICIFPEI
jgi:hypothetical protein